MANLDQYGPLADQIATQQGIPPALLRGVVQAESNWDPKAVSSAGAQGLGQLMPSTARGYGVTNSFDPTQNLTAAAKMLSGLLAKYHGDTELTLAAYNWGGANVDRVGGDLTQMPRETQLYVPRVLGFTVKFGGGDFLQGKPPPTAADSLASFVQADRKGQNPSPAADSLRAFIQKQPRQEGVAEASSLTPGGSAADSLRAFIQKPNGTQGGDSAASSLRNFLQKQQGALQSTPAVTHALPQPGQPGYPSMGASTAGAPSIGAAPPLTLFQRAKRSIEGAVNTIRGVKGPEANYTISGTEGPSLTPVQVATKLWTEFDRIAHGDNEAANSFANDFSGFWNHYQPGPKEQYWTQQKANALNNKLSGAEELKSQDDISSERWNSFVSMFKNALPNAAAAWKQAAGDVAGEHGLHVAQTLISDPMSPGWLKTAVTYAVAKPADLMVAMATHPINLLFPAMEEIGGIAAPFMRNFVKSAVATPLGQKVVAAGTTLADTKAGAAVKTGMQLLGTGPNSALQKRVMGPLNLAVSNTSQAAYDILRPLDREVARAQASDEVFNQANLEFTKQSGVNPAFELSRRQMLSEADTALPTTPEAHDLAQRMVQADALPSSPQKTTLLTGIVNDARTHNLSIQDIRDLATRQTTQAEIVADAHHFGLNPQVIQDAAAKGTEIFDQTQAQLAVHGKGLSEVPNMVPPTVPAGQGLALERNLARGQKAATTVELRSTAAAEAAHDKGVNVAENKALQRVGAAERTRKSGIAAAERGALNTVAKSERTMQTAKTTVENNALAKIGAAETTHKTNLNSLQRQVDKDISTAQSNHQTSQGRLTSAKRSVEKAQAGFKDAKTQVGQDRATGRLQAAQRGVNSAQNDVDKSAATVAQQQQRAVKLVEDARQRGEARIQSVTDEAQARVTRQQQLAEKQHQTRTQAAQDRYTTAHAKAHSDEAILVNRAQDFLDREKIRHATNKADALSDIQTKSVNQAAGAEESVAKKGGYAQLTAEENAKQAVKDARLSKLHDFTDDLFGALPRGQTRMEEHLGLEFKGADASNAMLRQGVTVQPRPGAPDLRLVREAEARNLVARIANNPEVVKPIALNEQPKPGWSIVPHSAGFEPIAGKQMPTFLIKMLDTEFGRGGMRSMGEGWSLYIMGKDIMEAYRKYGVTNLKKSALTSPGSLVGTFASRAGLAKITLEREGLSAAEQAHLPEYAFKSLKDVLTAKKSHTLTPDMAEMNSLTDALHQTEVRSSFLSTNQPKGQAKNYLFAGTKHPVEIPTSKWEGVKQAGSMLNPFNPLHIGDIASESHGISEQTFKLAVYRMLKDHGMSAAAAAKVVEERMLNYADRGVLLQMADRFGILPFNAFPTKAFGRFVDTVLNRPDLVAKYSLANHVAFNQEPGSRTDYEQLQPAEKGPLVYPVGRDKNGHMHFVNFARFTPFGNALDTVSSVADMVKNPSQATDILGGILKKHIFAPAYMNLVLNQSPLSSPDHPQQISSIGMPAKDRLNRHLSELAKDYLPTLVGGRGWQAISEAVNGITPSDYKLSQPKTVPEALLQYMLGLRLTTAETNQDKRVEAAPNIARRAQAVQKIGSQAFKDAMKNPNVIPSDIQDQVDQMNKDTARQYLFKARQQFRDLLQSGRMVDSEGNVRDAEGLQRQAYFVVALIHRFVERQQLETQQRAATTPTAGGMTLDQLPHPSTGNTRTQSLLPAP